MKIKRGVILAGIQPVMRPVLIAANAVWKSYNQELVVTSGLEGEHSAGSYHYYGLALDLGSKDFQNFSHPRAVIAKLQKILGFAYQVIYEGNHIHVEYDINYKFLGSVL